MVRSYFSYVPSGLSVRFLNLSSGDPDSFSWSFGTSGIPDSTDREPIVLFPQTGIYYVTLVATKSGQTPDINTLILPVGVTSLFDGLALPYLILDAITSRLPSSLLPTIGIIDGFIKKWQIFLRILIDPNIAIQNTYDQSKWPALVNDLIINLCLYDILTDKLSETISSSVSTGTTTNTGGLKRVVQGPAEAEWYSPSESSQAVSNVMKSGGLYDQVLNRICILASRLRIPLEFCPKMTFKGIAPSIYKPPPTTPLMDRDLSRNNEYNDISINPLNIHE